LDAARFGLAVYDRAGNPFFTCGFFAGNRSLRRENLTPVLGLPRGVGRVEKIGDMPVRSHLIALATGGTPLGGLKVTMSLQEIQAILIRERNTFLGTLAAVALLFVVLISDSIDRQQAAGPVTERIRPGQQAAERWPPAGESPGCRRRSTPRAEPGRDAPPASRPSTREHHPASRTASSAWTPGGST
jgi:hypothetical protein